MSPMKEQKPIKYQDVIDLGGKRDQFNSDKAYEDEHGHECFWVDIKLTKKFGAHWDCDTRTVEIQKYGGDGGGQILSVLPVKDLEELKMYINFFKGITPEEVKNPCSEEYQQPRYA